MLTTDSETTGTHHQEWLPLPVRKITGEQITSGCEVKALSTWKVKYGVSPVAMYGEENATPLLLLLAV